VPDSDIRILQTCEVWICWSPPEQHAHNEHMQQQTQSLQQYQMT
jgi:hypothetical protein